VITYLETMWLPQTPKLRLHAFRKQVLGLYIGLHMHTHTEVQQFTAEENHSQAIINILKLVSNKS